MLIKGGYQGRLLFLHSYEKDATNLKPGSITTWHICRKQLYFLPYTLV